MPANDRQNVKHYGIATPAGSNQTGALKPLTPDTPNRTQLLIQNTGGNPGKLHLGQDLQNNGTDFVIVSNGFWPPSGMFDEDNCPTDSISVGSEAATTWSIMEVTTPGASERRRIGRGV